MYVRHDDEYIGTQFLNVWLDGVHQTGLLAADSVVGYVVKSGEAPRFFELILVGNRWGYKVHGRVEIRDSRKAS